MSCRFSYFTFYLLRIDDDGSIALLVQLILANMEGVRKVNKAAE